MPIVTVVLLAIVIVLLLAIFVKISKVGSPMLDSRLDAFEKAQERTERAVREEVARSREELGKAEKEQRQELTEAFKVFGDSFAQRMVDVASVQKAQLDAFSDQLISFTKLSGERLDSSRAESAASANAASEGGRVHADHIFPKRLTGTMREWANLQKSQLDAFSEQLAAFARASGTRLDGVRAEIRHWRKTTSGGSHCDSQRHFRDDNQHDEWSCFCTKSDSLRHSRTSLPLLPKPAAKSSTAFVPSPLLGQSSYGKKS